jgi:hypothetical protein
MSEFFVQPDNLGELRASDLHSSLLQSRSALGRESFISDERIIP